MWDVRHEASKTDEGRYLGLCLGLVPSVLYLVCPHMKMASIPFSHTIPTKQLSTKGTQDLILQFHHSSLGPSTCD